MIQHAADDPAIISTGVPVTMLRRVGLNAILLPLAPVAVAYVGVSSGGF
jgi:hypothetical protein